MAKLSLLLAKLQSLHLQLSEEEIVQIANSLPETEVEVYLVGLAVIICDLLFIVPFIYR